MIEQFEQPSNVRENLMRLVGGQDLAPPSPSLRQVVRENYDIISRLREEGHSWRRVADFLYQCGARISQDRPPLPATVRKYFFAINLDDEKARPKGSRQGKKTEDRGASSRRRPMSGPNETSESSEDLVAPDTKPPGSPQDQDHPETDATADPGTPGGNGKAPTGKKTSHTRQGLEALTGD